ncbi:MAG TPA: bifunctional diaminohydroxyphosphoribosylaminopyrimidine deaminase/5-amino-6-(5-phosphoribosylamino)uracil reductase RibD [Longimicrobiales bacterium]
MSEPPVALDEVDRAFLERATELGRNGWGRVHPNPMVGCVLARDGAVVAEGWHEEFGGPHAEVVTLERAGLAAEGCTAYVSLEPCRHEGKTPACTGALLRAGVARVVFGAPDPGVESGGGAAELAGSGLEVVGPAFSIERARRENPAFFHVAETGTAFVALKLAVSLDGMIAEGPGLRTRLTGVEARREAHRLRAGFDAVLVGSGTVSADDPLLTVREPVPMRHAPARLVLDSKPALSTDAALFGDVERAPLVVFTREDAPEGVLEALERAGARVHPVPRARSGPGLDLRAVLRVCWDMGFRSVLCEGGGRLAASLVEAGLVGRLYLLVAPRILGEGGVPAFPGRRGSLGVAWTPAHPPVSLGSDVLLTYDPTDPAAGGSSNASGSAHQ